MERRAAGIYVLLLALVAALVLPRALGSGVTGTASIAAFPAPPAVGTCVTLTERSVLPVDCTEPHDAEVFGRWTAEDPDRPVHTAGACASGNAVYHGAALPAALSNWHPTVFNPTSELILAPSDDRVGSRGWSACLVRPASQARYVGSAVGAPGASRPAVYGRCLYWDQVTEVACDTPHSAEMLGKLWQSVDIPAGTPTDAIGLPATVADTLRDNCLALARLLTGNPDPTYGGQLKTVLTATSAGTGWGTSVGSVAQFDATCLLASDHRQLDDSLVGLGDAPLPTV